MVRIPQWGMGEALEFCVGERVQGGGELVFGRNQVLVFSGQFIVGVGGDSHRRG